MPPTLTLVHLVWGPLGPEPLANFVRAYTQHDPGVEHRLLVLLNGFTQGQDTTAWNRLLASIEHETLRFTRPVRDLGAYRAAVERIDTDRVCFVNSYSEPLVGDWLAKLVAPLDEERVGAAGPTGSYESLRTSAKRGLQPLLLGFPSFPNPALRTNGFALTRSLAVTLHWPAPRTKFHACLIESGARSLTRQITDRGRAVVVVGRDGIAYPVEKWEASATFRSGEQRNLLIADNRTRAWEQADPARRAELSLRAWGHVPAD